MPQPPREPIPRPHDPGPADFTEHPGCKTCGTPESDPRHRGAGAVSADHEYVDADFVPTVERDLPTGDFRAAEHPAAYLRRNPVTAARIEMILGLPNERWDGVQISFGHDGVAIATVGLYITGPQLEALARLAATPPAQP